MKTRHPEQTPCLVYANAQGEISELPELLLAGRSGHGFFRPEPADCIPLPEGSDLFVLPERLPVGIHPETNEAMLLDRSPDDPDEGIQAVAAFLAPAHTATFWAAYEKSRDKAPTLPLFAYAAVGWHDGQFWACGFRSDKDPRQEANRYAPQSIASRTNKQLKAHPGNRLIQHLGHCCLTYRCPAAVNYFMGKWEAPLPTSPACNAQCVGCISLQPSGCCASPQERIGFVPTPQEIAEVAVPHLNKTGHVASFGQGCEGEPLLQATTLEAAIRLIRKQTSLGTVNLNSNASLPEAVERLAHAGLDSMRVRMNSARPDYHTRYYRPKGFDLATVKESIRVMQRHQRFVSLNYFILPGFTDDPAEFAALCALIDDCRPDFVQLRNLNMDVEWYLSALDFQPAGEPLGIRAWLAALKKRFPHLEFGYYNPPLQPPLPVKPTRRRR